MVEYFVGKALERLTALFKPFFCFPGLVPTQEITLFHFLEPDLQFHQVLLVLFIFSKAEIFTPGFLLDLCQEIIALFYQLFVLLCTVLAEPLQDLRFGLVVHCVGHKGFTVPALVL